MVPVGQGESAAIGGHSKTADRGDVGKPSIPGVEVGAVSLAAAPRRAASHELDDSAPGFTVRPRGLPIARIGGRGRHDLPPKETSQIAAIGFGGEIAVGNHQVGPGGLQPPDEHCSNNHRATVNQVIP